MPSGDDPIMAVRLRQLAVAQGKPALSACFPDHIVLPCDQGRPLLLDLLAALVREHRLVLLRVLVLIEDGEGILGLLDVEVPDKFKCG